MSRHNRERRLRRQEQKKQGVPPKDQAELASFLKNFERAAKTPEPATWPGASDPALSRPDQVKSALAAFAIENEPGRSMCRQFEHALERGVLGGLRNLKHWGMEEFLWHGAPGQSWNPVEEFLIREKERFSTQAVDQLRLWKEARLGFFEVGPVIEDRVVLREWDAVTGVVFGPDFHAIALNIGGVNFYQDQQDAIQLTYVAPWAPEQNLFCSMGYGLLVPSWYVPGIIPYLGLLHPEIAARPLPWKVSASASYDHAKEWRKRDWHGWLTERLRFPFHAVVPDSNREPVVAEVESLLPSTVEEFQQFGLYFGMKLGREEAVIGATAPLPCEPISDNAFALSEYRAYRDLVGPPPGVKGMPLVIQVEDGP